MATEPFDPFEEARQPCDCLKCVGAEYRYDDSGRKHLINTMEHHTFLEECDDCGRPKTEYRDLGRKGRYVCWWCNRRAAEEGKLDE